MKFFSKKISTSLETAKQNIQNKFDSERIQMVAISNLKFDKDFADKNEALKYELHLQLDRRNLSDAEVFAMFKKLEGMKQNAKAEGKSTEDFTDAKIAEKLKKSERQVQKMRELSKKADKQTLDKVASGELTINQAYSEVRKSEHPKHFKTCANSSIYKSEFIKGVKFALDELANGKTAEEILAAL